MRRRHGDPLSGRGRLDLSEALRGRREEIVQEVLTRVHSISELSGDEDPEYALGLREAAAGGVDYALTAIASGERRAGPVPRPLLDQAGQAARNRVSLDVVLRRYFAGQAVLSDFVIAELNTGRDPAGATARYVLRSLSTLLDRSVSAVAAEYARVQNSPKRQSSTKQRRDLVDQLLRGGMPDSVDLDYDLGRWHIGLVGSGSGFERAVRDLAADLDRQALLVGQDETTLWGWLGGRSPIASADLAGHARATLPAGVVLAIGEAGQGRGGWRTSFEQARAAFPLARRSGGIVQYADVAVVATALHDRVLLASLRQRFLDPLNGDAPDRAASLKETALTYLASGHSMSSTAAALKVTRQTVRTRIRAVEQRVGCPLDRCAADLEIALRLEELGQTEGLLVS